MDETTQGLCSHCGHVNELKWQLCDACGERLPWAPPKDATKGIADLSDDQLKVLFSQPPRSKVPLLLRILKRRIR